MRRETAERYLEFLDNMAHSYGVRPQQVKQCFAATVPMAQKLNDAVQKSSEFLSRISMIGEVDSIGEVITMDIHSSIAKRTNVSKDNPRQPQMAGGPDGRQWKVEPTEFDVGISYALLDVWARYSDFHQRYMSSVYRRIGLDRIMIGWYGQEIKAETDREAKPQLEDVNTGWLYDLKNNNAAHYMTGGKTEGEISIGPGGDYKNIDQLVNDIASMIPKVHRTGQEVAIIGEGLVTHDTNKTYELHGENPLQKAHIQLLGKSYGAIQAITIPHFPNNGLMVTDLKNLQIYWQLSGMRRQNRDEPEYNRIVDYISSNECYRIGELNSCAAIEADNVIFTDDVEEDGAA